MANKKVLTALGIIGGLAVTAAVALGLKKDKAPAEVEETNEELDCEESDDIDESAE